MSYLTKLKLKKISKLTRVFKANKYDEFPDDIYSKPAKKSYMIAWASQLNKYSKLTDEDLLIETNIIAIEKSFYQMVLLSSCLGDGSLIGNAFNDKDIEGISEVNHEAATALFTAACKSNKIEKSLAEFFCEFLNGIYSIEFDLSKLDVDPVQSKPKRGRPKKVS